MPSRSVRPDARRETAGEDLAHSVSVGKVWIFAVCVGVGRAQLIVVIGETVLPTHQRLSQKGHVIAAGGAGEHLLRDAEDGQAIAHESLRCITDRHSLTGADDQRSNHKTVVAPVQ